MIGHYLLTLTKEQEERMLTEIFQPYIRGGPCLIMATEPGLNCIKALTHRSWGTIRGALQYGYGLGRHRHEPFSVAYRAPAYAYEQACCRFGFERVNAAIRNRILANQARRALQPVGGPGLQVVSA